MSMERLSQVTQILLEDTFTTRVGKSVIPPPPPFASTPPPPPCATVFDSSIDPSRLAEDGAVGSVYDGSSGGSIMLVDSRATVRSPPEHTCSPRDFCNFSRSPFGGPEHTSATRSDLSSSGSGDDSGVGKRTSRRGPAALLFDERGHRREMSNYSGDEVGSDDSPRHQRWPGNAKDGGSAPLCGPGGLLSPWRVRVLLLLQCLISVRAQMNAVFSSVLRTALALSGCSTAVFGVPMRRRKNLREHSTTIVSVTVLLLCSHTKDSRSGCLLGVTPLRTPVLTKIWSSFLSSGSRRLTLAST